MGRLAGCRGGSLKTPRHTTHVKLVSEFGGSKRTAMLSVKDMDCMAGAAGKVTFLRQLHGKDKFEELGSFDFDGKWPIEERTEQ